VRSRDRTRTAARAYTATPTRRAAGAIHAHEFMSLDGGPAWDDKQKRSHRPADDRLRREAIPRQAIVGDWLPGRSRGDVVASAGPDAGVVIERSHPDPDRLREVPPAAEQRRAAVAAEPLLTTILRLPGAKPLLAGEDSQAAGRRSGVDGGGRSGATLTASAVAVMGDDEGFGDLEAHGPAVAPARQRRFTDEPSRSLGASGCQSVARSSSAPTARS
jgi:hypothetical protein